MAALCERQNSFVAGAKEPIHDTIALGMRRAAAIGGDLPGENLLALLQGNCWDELEMLGRDEREFHRLPRGRRSPTLTPSKTLMSLYETAEAIRGGTYKEVQTSDTFSEWGEYMSYDIEESVHGSEAARPKLVRKKEECQR